MIGRSSIFWLLGCVLVNGLTLDVATLGSGTLASRLSTSDSTLTLAGFDGPPAPLDVESVNGVGSLGVASISTNGGAEENATIRGSEQLQLRFRGSATLQSLTLTAFGISDGPLQITGFPIDPMTLCPDAGVLFVYDAATETLTVQPPSQAQATVTLSFHAASLVRVLSLTAPAVAGTARGVGINSVSYDMVADTAPRPNILIINCDDLGYGELGVLWQNSLKSQKKYATPQLDKLASEGMILTSHFCSTPICVASRAQLMLGESAGHCNVRDQQFGKPIADKPTLGTVAHKAGYHTFALGKWGCSSFDDKATLQDEFLIGMPETRGFDMQSAGAINRESYYPTDAEDNYEGAGYGKNPIANGLNCAGAYHTDLYGAKAKQTIIEATTNEPDRPWLIYLAPKAPHEPMTVPSQAFPAGFGLSGGLTWPLNTLGGAEDTYIYPDYAATDWPEAEKRHATIIRRLDDVIGDLIQTLKDLNISNNTLVFFTADNGPGAVGHDVNFFESSGPYDGFKRDLYDGGLRQPTMAWWPGHIAPGTSSDQNTAQYDLMATIAELSGISPPGRGDGLSFAPLLKNSGPVRNHPFLYWEFDCPSVIIDPTILSRKNYADFSRRDQMQALRIGHQIGIRYDITDPQDPLHLYDTRADLHEDYDLATVPALQPVLFEIQDRLRQARRPLADSPRPYDAAMVAPRPPSGIPVPGLRYASFAGLWPWVPDFREISPISEGIAADVNLAVRPQEENFGLHFEGWIQVPVSGVYTFSLAADQGALLWLHDSRLVDGDSLNGAEANATMNLAAGYHPIRIYYTHRSGASSLNLSWSGPGFGKTSVSASSLFHDEGAPRLDMVARDDWQSTQAGVPVLIDVLANDFHRSPFTTPAIVAVTSPPGGEAVISGCKILYTPRAGFLGMDSFQYTLSDGALTHTANVTVDIYSVNEEIRLPFDQNAGDSTSDASGEIRAIVQGFKKNDARWSTGRIGQAFAPKGGGGTLVLPNHRGITRSLPRTISAWIKTTSSNAICAWGDNSITGAKWVMSLKSGENLMAPDGSVIFSAANGSLHRAAVKNDTSLGIRGIKPSEGNPENASVRGNERLKISFPVPAALTGIGLVSFGPLDGVVRLAGFSADPGASSLVAGVNCSYNGGTLYISPPGTAGGVVPIIFTSASAVAVLTLTAPDATDAGNGVGLSSISYNGTSLPCGNLIGTGGDGALNINVGGGQVTGTTDLRDNLWHHVACTFQDDGSPDVGDVKLFVNGVEEARTCLTHQTVRTAASSPVTIGSAFGTGYFEGGIDEFRLIPQALSPAEIAAIAAHTNTNADLWYYRYFGPGTPLWTLDEDNDGYDRYQEYALGLRPLLPDFSPLSLDNMADGVATLTTFRRSPGNNGLQYTLETSSDLGATDPWTPAGFTELKVIPYLDGTEEVTLQTLVGGGDRLFFRWSAKP